MKTNIVSITKSLILNGDTNDLTAEELIVYIARVSNPSNQLNKGTSSKLIAYLIANKHWSPFEMVDMTVEITTSRAIAQQILRHRSFSFQEFSQRYAQVTAFEGVQIRKQADKNRQSSTDEFDPQLRTLTSPDAKPASSAIADHITYSEDLYKSLIDAGVAKECARMVLPLTTQTTIYMKGSIRSWIHYLQIRTDAHTQLEHQQIAIEIEGHFQSHFPNVYQALKEI